MLFEPLRPNELALHRDLRDALNEGLTSTGFSVWIAVADAGDATRLEDPERIVRETQRWLDTLDPDAIHDPAAVPEMRFADPAAEVTIRAVPRRREVRATRAPDIVVNPEPALAGWS